MTFSDDAKPVCPGCGLHVDAMGEQHEIAWVDGVLWHAICVENREIAEMKDDPFASLDVPFTDTSNS